jgi:hypothetical protein
MIYFLPLRLVLAFYERSDCNLVQARPKAGLNQLTLFRIAAAMRGAFA